MIRPGGDPAARPASFLLALVLAYLALVVYASLSPFTPWIPFSELHWRFLLAPLPRRLLNFDLLLNIVAYCPLGALLAALASRWRKPAAAVALAALGGALLSLSMETLQVLLPPRIPSNVDLVTNTLGSLLGALPWLAPARLQRACAPLEDWRHHLLLPGCGTELGALLLLLWGISHLNPSIPYLGAGVMPDSDALAWYENATEPVDWMLQAWAAALNACGIGLFLGALTHARINAPAAALFYLVGVLGAKATAAEFLLKPALVGDWFSSATLAGLAAGAVALLAVQRLGHRRRVLWAGICLLAGGLMAKIGSNYEPLSALRRLFGWNFSQLSNFAGLTLWLNEIWPLLALMFLVLWWPQVPVPEYQVSSGP